MSHPAAPPRSSPSTHSSTGTRAALGPDRNRREALGPVVYGILSIVLILALMQLWLLTATMNAYLGGDRDVAWPALGTSAVCLLLNLGLLRYLYLLERQR